MDEEDRKMLTAYRLANTMHSEIAQSLPLPSLPISFGASAQEISLVDRARNMAIMSKAAKIADLLNSTDISYVTLKDKSNQLPIEAEPGSLEAAVLGFRANAFDCCIFGQAKQEAENEAVSALNLVGSPSGNSPKHSASSLAHEQVHARVKKKPRLKRKSHQVEEALEHGHLVESGITTGLCELLNEFLDRTEGQGDPDAEEEGPILSLQDIRSIGEEISKLHAKASLNKVPPEQLIRLLDLLDRHTRQAHLKEIDENDDVESENFEIVMTAIESTQITLMVMSSPQMPKQIYKEELIERLIEFTRYQIVHSIFTAYDPMYRQLHKSPGQDDEEGDEEDDGNDANHTKKARRKSKAGRVKKLSKISTAVSNILHKLCIILALLKQLLSVERLADSTILQLMKTVLGAFGVDNIQLLQLKAIGVACAVFSLYPQHRNLITDEVISMLWKIPLSKRNLRTYHLPDEEPKQIQMLTALLLHLVQCSVFLPELSGPNSGASADPTKCFEPAVNACNYFWVNVLQRWALPKAQDGSDTKAVIENLVVDLLNTLNVPEFPASSLVLQILCVLLLGPAGVKSKDVAVRVNAIELLGQIAAHLKKDAVLISRDELWILQELHEGNKVEPSGDACTVCNSSKSNKFSPRCDDCKRWFHGDCVGVTAQDLLGRGWLCLCCLCKKQLDIFNSSNSKSPQAGKSDNALNVRRSGVVIVQQILWNFLHEAGTEDSTLSFYLCLWYRYDAEGATNLPFYHWRYSSNLPPLGVTPGPLFRDSVVRITRALGQQRPLARGFDRILERLLATLQENASNPRAKALKAVSGIVEVDPDVLADERVQKAVEGRFLDTAISVREAAMELVGRHIVSRPDVAFKYFDRLSERILDTGVSVRKRVIKIIRDFCLSKGGFPKTTDACIRVISRINDDEASIQDLVCKTFYEMWFEDSPGPQANFVADGSVVPVDVAERAQQLVNVLKNLSNHQPLVLIIKRSLALDFIPQTKTAVPPIVSQAAVRNRCELMCTYFLECILKAEESSEDYEVQALPYISALHAFCVVDPTLCAPSSDPARFAMTLEPYLKTQADNRDIAQLLQNIVYVIDMVLPLLRRPAESFVEELERDLAQLILRYPFLNVVHACIKCLSSLTKISSRKLSQFGGLVRHFYNVLHSSQKVALDQEKPGILRALFCLGLFVRYGAELIDDFDEPDVTMELIIELYKHYLCLEDLDLKCRGLQALGFVFLARPHYTMEEELQKHLEDALAPGCDTRIKINTLRIFYEYLLDVEKQMGSGEKEDKVDASNAVPVAAGAGDSNICGGIIQFHWERILESCLDSNDQVRQAGLKLVEVVLRQGLVHPMTCVPQLIALEVDRLETNAKLAHRLLSNMNEKYPTFFESRLGDGLQMSFSFIQSGIIKQNKDQKEAALARGGIARIYKLIRGARNSRNKFMSSVVRKFDWVASGQASIPFLIYCTEILTSLPFSLLEEPLYLIFAINRILQVRAGDLEASMKAEFSQEPLHSYVKTLSGGGTEIRIDVPEDLLMKLQLLSNAAIALSLLLKMKRHLKISYSLDDARCQAFQPSEHNSKATEVLSKQAVKEFSCSDLPPEQPRSISEVVQRYQVFKSLLKEDTMDYASYAPTSATKKRARPSGDGLYQGHGHAGGKMRRKSAPADGSDMSEHLGEGDGDEDYGGTVKRRKSSATGSASKAKNRRLVAAG